MTTLRTDKKWKAGQVNIIPLIGETQISDDCTIEVEDPKVAEELAAIPDLDFYIVDSPETVKGKVTPKVVKEPVKTEETKVETADSIQEQTVGSEELAKTETTDDIVAQTTESDELAKTESQIKNNLSAEKQEKDPIEELSSLTVAKLQDLAAPFPKEEWQTLKKADLINYLAAQLENAK